MVNGRISALGRWPGVAPIMDADGVSVVRSLENPALRMAPFAATFAAMVLSRCGGTIEPISQGERVGYDFALRLA